MTVVKPNIFPRPTCWKHLLEPSRASSASSLDFEDCVLQRTFVSRAVFPYFKSFVADSGSVEESHFDIDSVRERTGSGHLKGISVLWRTQTSRAVIPCFESLVANSGYVEESFRHQPGSRACRNRLFEGV